MTLYNSIGTDYNNTRGADQRIVNNLIKFLSKELGSSIIELGAGTGNYAYGISTLGYKVTALEPSEIMINQRKIHTNIEWVKGFAENIPYRSGHFDGALCVLAAHHFSSIQNSVEETHRVLNDKGSFVMFQFDLNLMPPNCWFNEYFVPYFGNIESQTPSCSKVSEIVSQVFKSTPTIVRFPLPSNLRDGFFYSAWRYPEKYLDSEFRKGISIFSIAGEENVARAIKHLRTDLMNGVWDKKYGYVRNLSEYEVDYYFLTVKKG
jgi:ubiquinone/menaquinone biosynthesis C-methylase UbiE